MQKDFDKWNCLKKHINLKGLPRFYREKEVWWCSLGVNVGFEQDGRGEGYERPVLVLKAFSKSVCWVLPLTSSQKENRYHFYLGIIDGRESFAILSQIKILDTRRFINRIAVLNNKTFIATKTAFKDLL